MAVLDDLKQAIISGNREHGEGDDGRRRWARALSAKTIVVDGIAAAMEVVGEKFRTNEFFVPELLIAQRAMKECLKLMSGRRWTTSARW